MGVAVPPSLHAYRVARMLAFGFNAWRTAHNPPDPALLDACDRMGMLVLLEHSRNDASRAGVASIDAMVRARW